MRTHCSFSTIPSNILISSFGETWIVKYSYTRSSKIMHHFILCAHMLYLEIKQYICPNPDIWPISLLTEVKEQQFRTSLYLYNFCWYFHHLTHQVFGVASGISDISDIAYAVLEDSTQYFYLVFLARMCLCISLIYTFILINHCKKVLGIRTQHWWSYS